jgi:hypothetical protein
VKGRDGNEQEGWTVADWKVWRPVYAQFNLRDHGDAKEQRGAKEYGLDLRFPNWQEFWRNHVVPCTRRPQGICFRNGVADVTREVSELNYSAFADLVRAADSLRQVRNGELGGPEYRNCVEVIKSSGDALQKFTELQTAVEKRLAAALGRTIKLWTDKQWKSVWRPSREKVIGYRHHLTHRGEPQFIEGPAADGSSTPYVLKHKYVVRDKDLGWAEQMADFRRNPGRWAPLADVCAELYDGTIEWLDKAYQRLVWKLRALPGDRAYQQLWGWDATLGPGMDPTEMERALQCRLGGRLTVVMSARSNVVMATTGIHGLGR